MENQRSHISWGQLLSLCATTRGSINKEPACSNSDLTQPEMKTLKNKICFHHSTITLKNHGSSNLKFDRDFSSSSFYSSCLLSFLHLLSFLNPFLFSAFLQSHYSNYSPGHPPSEDYHSLLISLSALFLFFLESIRPAP